MFKDIRDAISMFRGVHRVAKKLQELEERLKQMRLEGKGGGDLVRVVLDGTGKALEVKIDPVVLAQQDPEFLEELLRSAITDAIRQLQEEARSATQSALAEAMMSSDLAMDEDEG